MIKINNVSKTYKSTKGNECSALKGINLALNDTGMVFIVGKSGSGKTTLLNILGGLDNPDDGYLVIDGKSTEDFNEKDYDSYRNTSAGFIFQEFNLIESLNVEENVIFSSELLNEKTDKNKVNEILKSVGLEGLNNRKINELSGGQKQRVAIARILNKDCNYIFADEPTGNLDTKAGKQIFDLLKQLSKTKLVVIVSHDQESAKNYADRIIEVKNGEIIKDVTRVDAEIKDEFYQNSKGEVFIPSSRALTKKEIKKLNDMLKSEVKEIKTTPKQFKNTKIANLEETKTFEAKYSKLSLKNTVKFAFNNIKVKVGRCCVIIFILVIALTLLGFTSFFSEFDGHIATFKTLNANDIEKMLVTQGKYNSKIKQLENRKTIFTDTDFIDEYEKLIGDNYLELKNILVHRPNENTFINTLKNIDSGYTIDSEEDLNKMDFSILKGEYKENNNSNGYVNLMITDVTWYIHCISDSTLLTQTLKSSTAHKFETFLSSEIESLDDENKAIVIALLSKIDGSNDSVVELSNLEKIKLFSIFKESGSLMDFVLDYFKNNSSWNSDQILYRITGIINTGIDKYEKLLIDSIVSKNDSELLTDEEERFSSKINLYYKKVYGDFTKISGYRMTHIYSTVGSRVTLTNSLNSNSIYPSTTNVASYTHFYAYQDTTYFLGANAGKNLMLRNEYETGTINDKNNYELLSPIKIVNVRPPIKEEFPFVPPIEEKPGNGLIPRGLASNKKPFIPVIPTPIAMQKGLLNNDIILDKDMFSNLFGAEAIDKYFVSQTEETKKEDLMIYIQLTEGAEPIAYRVVGIAGGGGVAMMMSIDGLNNLILNNNIHDSYLINLSNDEAENIKLLELLEKHNSYYNSEVGTIMYQIISIFGVFELVFIVLTIVLILLVIILTSNFIRTSIIRKTKEIGLLRALGVTKVDVSRIFLCESLLIGIVSSLLAIIFSVLAVNPINELVILSLPKFFETELSIEVSLLTFNTWMIPVIISISIISCVASTIVPAYRIGKIKPSESMRAINK